ncbi:Fic family protein [Roseateles cellulosilyticus]|uniref:Fic family protein n=1 Tax=Pelomonas cellulosilytica TaxID=2906762 RepID=A0ABS8Y4G6_9BURK|nr:Fic family protein [Pelomonas sp. P8]MCE4558134.1 Fic family protein [Pelomonas sp. P8]
MPNVEGHAGYKWLSEQYGVAPVQPFRVRSVIGTARSSAASNGFAVETYPAHYQPDATLIGHLTFALKYEGVELDFLKRLFDVTGPAPIAQWALTEPTGAYARRCGFLYEWLTDSMLEGVGDAGGNYVDLLNESQYLTATVPDKVRRWRVNNNLPGTRTFCPMVDLGKLGGADPVPLRDEIDKMVNQFGLETVERAVNWLTIKESKASFAIESEAKEEDRIRRLARAMSLHCGKLESALTEDGLLMIQQAIMGDKMVGAQLGIRHSPVFVGHTNSIYEPVIDYLAPHHEWLAEMMDGLRAFESRTRGRNPLLRSAALSFGFVYIHPLGDGNGRLSRFLINDILRRDGFLPAPVILPVSAVISENAVRRAAYDTALERLSRPLMATMNPVCTFGTGVRYEDGVESNLHVVDWNRGQPTWRYADLTVQSEYLIDVIRHSILHGLKDEAVYLVRYEAARNNLKEIIEGRDEDYAAIIRSLVTNMKVSGKLRRTYPRVFTDEHLAQRVECAVFKAFELLPDDEDEGDDAEPRLDVAPR